MHKDLGPAHAPPDQADPRVEARHRRRHHIRRAKRHRHHARPAAAMPPHPRQLGHHSAAFRLPDPDSSPERHLHYLM